MTIKALIIGIGIERKAHTAIDPDSAENLFAARKRAVHQKSGMCAVPVWMQGRGEVLLEDATIAEISFAWLQDLDSLGEALAMQGQPNVNTPFTRKHTHQTQVIARMCWP